MSAVSLVQNGLSMGQALELGIINKSFDDFERQLVADIIAAKISEKLTAAELFEKFGFTVNNVVEKALKSIGK